MRSSFSSDGERVRGFVEQAFRASLREPAGGLRHPYVDPGAGYGGILWDWDAYFCCAGLAPWAAEVGPHARGCVRNFMDHQGDDGHVPYCLTASSTRRAVRPADGPANSAKPLLAQFALLAADYLGDRAWLSEVYPGLCRHVTHWEATQQGDLGLFTFRSHRGSGSDNHPAVYGRPLNSSADVFLNRSFRTPHSPFRIRDRVDNGGGVLVR